MLVFTVKPESKPCKAEYVSVPDQHRNDRIDIMILQLLHVLFITSNIVSLQWSGAQRSRDGRESDESKFSFGNPRIDQDSS